MHLMQYNANMQVTPSITIAGAYIIIQHANGKITRDRTYMMPKELNNFIQGFVNMGYVHKTN